MILTELYSDRIFAVFFYGKNLRLFFAVNIFCHILALFIRVLGIVL